MKIFRMTIFSGNDVRGPGVWIAALYGVSSVRIGLGWSSELYFTNQGLSEVPGILITFMTEMVLHFLW